MPKRFGCAHARIRNVAAVAEFRITRLVYVVARTRNALISQSNALVRRESRMDSRTPHGPQRSVACLACSSRAYAIRKIVIDCAFAWVLAPSAGVIVSAGELLSGLMTANT